MFNNVIYLTRIAYIKCHFIILLQGVRHLNINMFYVMYSRITVA